MLYLDQAGATEESLNEFYKKVYTTDDLPFSDDRLNSLMQAVVDLPVSWGDPIMDIGGMDGVLMVKLQGRGFTDVSISGPGAEYHRKYKVFILSHTLEHVYNTHGMLEKIKDHIFQNGLVIVEVPIWAEDSPFTYDRHWEHINKFTPQHLKRLFKAHGFKVRESIALPNYREYNCHRLVVHYG
jgi:hypothetical protein